MKTIPRVMLLLYWGVLLHGIDRSGHDGAGET